MLKIRHQSTYWLVYKTGQVQKHVKCHFNYLRNRLGFFLSLFPEWGESVYKAWPILKKQIINRKLVPFGPQRGREAGRWVASRNVCSPRPFHPLWWRACPESLSSASYGPGENYGYILNENGKAVKAGSGVGDRLKSMKTAGPFWSPIIICGTAKCPFKKLWKGLCQNYVPWEQCWWGIAGPPGWCKWRPLHKD